MDICSVLWKTVHRTFQQVDELLDWYSSLAREKRAKHISRIEDGNYLKTGNYLVIYSHLVCLEPHKSDSGYFLHKGEISSTDEAFIYSFKENKWVS